MNLIFLILLQVCITFTKKITNSEQSRRLYRANIQQGYGAPPRYGVPPPPPSSAPPLGDIVDLRTEDKTPELGAYPGDSIDLHNNEFCVNVSSYQSVVWEERDGKECFTNFVKKCEERSEDVCADVTETICEVVPYTECALGLEPQQFNETTLEPKKFVEKACTHGTKSIPHKKLLPECRNVTKQNCVTLWEIDQYGEQVWAGKEGCEPVSWQECKLVSKDVNFVVPEIICSDKQELWYHQPEPRTRTRMTNTFTCEVKTTISCTYPVREDCKQITWNECREVPVTNCNPKKVHIPTQDVLHRKKCLHNDDGQGYGAGAPPA